MALMMIPIDKFLSNMWDGGACHKELVLSKFGHPVECVVILNQKPIVADEDGPFTSDEMYGTMTTANGGLYTYFEKTTDAVTFMLLHS